MAVLLLQLTERAEYADRALKRADACSLYAEARGLVTQILQPA